MEPRTITVIDTRINGVITFESSAETMAEMLEDFASNNIDATDMAIQEGLTRTELNETSILPRDVAYRGTTTNNLVFRLTQKEKKIKSGLSERRQAIYNAINNLGIAELVKERFGRNYTQVATDDLEAFLNHDNEDANEEEDSEENTSACPLYDAFEMLVEALAKSGFITFANKKAILEVLNKEATADSVYSSHELNEMFSNM